MAKRDKRIAALRRNPKNVRPEELDQVLRAAGFVARQESTSHRRYTNGPHSLTIAQRKPFVAVGAVKEVLDLLDILGEEDADDES
jgi:hypothetical protein